MSPPLSDLKKEVPSERAMRSLAECAKSCEDASLAIEGKFNNLKKIGGGGKQNVRTFLRICISVHENLFPVWLRNRLLSAVLELELILSHTEKSSTVS